MSDNQYLHEVAVSAIITKGGKYLITRRALTKKRFPGFWTVPGGKLETNDYINLPKDTDNFWYNVLEKVVLREVKEEVGINIKNIRYVTNLTTIYGDIPSLVISCKADYVSGKINLQLSEVDQFAWVTLEQAKKYQLIDGIYDELVRADGI